MLRWRLPTILRAPEAGAAGDGGTGGAPAAGASGAPPAGVPPPAPAPAPEGGLSKEKLSAARALLEKVKGEQAVMTKDLADTQAELKKYKDAETKVEEEKAKAAGNYDELNKKKDDELSKANALLAEANATIETAAAEKRTGLLIAQIVENNKGSSPIIVGSLLDTLKKRDILKSIDPPTDKLAEIAKSAAEEIVKLDPGALKPQAKKTGGGFDRENPDETFSDVRDTYKQEIADAAAKLGLRINPENQV